MLDRRPSVPRARRALLALLILPALTTPAEAGDWSERLRGALDVAEAASQSLAADARRAIVLGGVVLYRYRHTIAGATLGCAAGSLAGAGSAVSAAPATGGASLNAALPLAALGCGAGALAGAALGRPLDRVYDEP